MMIYTTPLTSHKCGFCEEYGPMLFLPTRTRTCHECLRTSPRMAVIRTEEMLTWLSSCYYCLVTEKSRALNSLDSVIFSEFGFPGHTRANVNWPGFNSSSVPSRAYLIQVSKSGSHLQFSSISFLQSHQLVPLRFFDVMKLAVLLCQILKYTKF